jgi:hypothetical protein
MNTFKAVLQADWAPAIKSIARFLGRLVAVAIVLIQGLATTESCGVFALTPVSPVVITAPVARPQQKGRLSLRLPEAQLQQLEAIASRHGVPRCDAARDLLAQALAALEVAE